ncbi:MAG: efflux RND transporter permease subunit, partial [Bacillota bacterium]|nr:efflux RND transporter permease subunit [Bacillota bacterium]
MKLANFSVNRPVTVVMVVLAILLIGAVSLGDLNLDLFPEINLPVAAVLTSYDGSAPQEVENMVTRTLENTLGTVSNVTSITSTSSTGNSMILINFEFGTDMDFATLEIREKVDVVKGFLPDDAGEPLILKMDPAMMPILQLGIGGDIPIEEVKRLAEDTIKPRLERIEGIASVDITGGISREILVTVEPKKLQTYGLALSQVTQALQVQNMSLSAGKVTEGTEEIIVRVTGEFIEVAQIAETPITTPAGNIIRLKDVAEVEDAFKEITSYSRVNDVTSIGLSIQKQASANTVQVVREARAALVDIRQQLPIDLEIATILDQAEFIEFSIQNVVKNLIIGGALAVLVLFVFLRNIRSTLVIGLAMPISVIATFILMYFGGLSLNMMSLGGLALGVGMMVDSAIVVVENIFRYREQGHDQIGAAKLGANEVSNAIAAATFTTVAVFFPIVYVDGIASELFTELALTVSFALIASLVVALTLIPMLASRLLKVNGDDKRHSKIGPQVIVKAAGGWFESLAKIYGHSLKWCLSHRKTTVVTVTVLLISSLALIPMIGAEFIPAVDEGLISIRVDMPDGAKLDETDAVVRQIEAALAGFKNEIETVSAMVGGSGGFDMGSSNPGRGQLELVLVPREQREYSTNGMVKAITKKIAKIAGAEITVTENSGITGMGMAGAPIEVSVKGDDLEQLYSVAQELTVIIEQTPGTKDVSNSFEEGQEEIQLIVDRA